MALVVPTPPPDLVVKTMVKKGRTRADESPILCDSFWACVLDDYLDDDLDSGIVEDSRHQQPDVHPARRKHRSSSKKELAKKYMEKIQKAQQESDKHLIELDSLLSDDQEMDQREKDVIEPSRSNDVVLSILKQEEKQGMFGRDSGPEEETDYRAQKKNKKKAQRIQIDLGPEQEDVDYEEEKRARSNGEVFHYSPLGHGPKNRQSHGHQNRRESRRVPVDPADDQGATNRTSRFRDGGRIKYLKDFSSGLPDDPSEIRQKPHPTRPSASRRTRESSGRKGASRVETIDLTDQVFLSAGRKKHPQTEASSSSMAQDDPLEWAIRDGKRGDADYRRRKLDRKEALDRIRAIKARLHTVDP